MKTILVPAAALSVGLACGGWAAAQDRFRDDPPVHEHELEHETDAPVRQRGRQVEELDPHAHEHEHADPHGRGQAADRTALIRQRAAAVANELDRIQEQLEEHLQEGHGDQGMRRLFRQADTALAAAVHFRRTLKPGMPPQEVAEHFRELDGQLHGLIEAMESIDDRDLRRAASRLDYADEQLHAAAVTGAGRPGADFVVRQAHVLAGEAQRLERAARATIAEQDHEEEGDHRGDRELLEALRDFAGKVAEFHETVETGRDAGHVAQDFEVVDQSWHRVVDLMNRNPHGAYLSRRAERVGSMHDELSRVVGVKTERRLIHFDVEAADVEVGR